MTIVAKIETKIPPSTLALRLRIAREWRDLKQAELAEALDVSRATIGNYESGTTHPSRLQINAWAVTCDVDVEWLKGGAVGPTGFGPVASTVKSQRFGHHHTSNILYLPGTLDRISA